MLDRTFTPSRGPRVRVRLGRRADAAGAVALLSGCGVAADELEVRRLLTYDPARRCVACAFALIDGAESLVGLGAIDLHDRAEPDALMGDAAVVEVLDRMLRERARSHGRRVA